MTTFADQSIEYIRGLRQSRNPASPSTLRAYQSYLDANLLPQIGSRALTDLDNGAAKAVFGPLADKLSAKTVRGHFDVFKGVIASAIDSNGNEIYPRKWNLSFIDLPSVVPAEQNTPEIPRKTLQEAFLGGSPEDRRLWAFLAGSGLRIGEALAVRTTPEGQGNYWDRAAGTVDINVQRHENGTFGPLKTSSSRRIVDLCQPLNNFLVASMPQAEFLFGSKERAARKRFDRAISHTGFHAFRRFRETQTELAGAPTTLAYFWAGHAGEDIHQRYAKWTMRPEERREWADRVGLGFELPQ